MIRHFSIEYHTLRVLKILHKIRHKLNRHKSKNLNLTTRFALVLQFKLQSRFVYYKWYSPLQKWRRNFKGKTNFNARLLIKSLLSWAWCPLAKFRLNSQLLLFNSSLKFRNLESGIILSTFKLMDDLGYWVVFNCSVTHYYHGDALN